MGDGWRKGLGHYSAASAGLKRGEDYRNSEIRKAGDESADGGYSGALPRGGAPRHKPKGPSSLKPVAAASPTGKLRRA